VSATRIAHLAVAHQALHQRDVDPPAGPALAAADRAYVPVSNRQERPEPFAPLIDELAAMDEDKGVHASHRNHLGADHGLAEGSRGGQHAAVVGLDCGDGRRLCVVQGSEKLDL
jgi:hypothetical protein